MILLPLTSLPRSGSTLLMSILGQNSKFHLGDDSEIGNLLNYNKQFMINNIQHFQLPHEVAAECFYEFCRSGVKSWISNLTSHDKIFLDKSRHWLKDLDYFFNIFPDLKIIINIRDLRGIINSFEKIHNNSLFIDKQRFYNQLNSDLQRQRVNNILNIDYLKNGLVSIKEIIDIPKKYKDRIFVCKYENLLNDPAFELEKIYEFLDLPVFKHNFEEIDQKPYHDNPYQPYGCHKIKPKIENRVETFSDLKPDIANMIINEYKWYYDVFYR
jgi:sulfotransferase